MRGFYIKYNRTKFWETYWKEFDVDPGEFVDLDIYPIDITLKHVREHCRILEAGFGGGRVIRHLHRHGYDIEGIEYDGRIVERLKQADPSLKIFHENILNLHYADNCFDVALCFGVIGGLEKDTPAAVRELGRVVRNGGLLIVSVMLDNAARLVQKALNTFSREKLDFYAWMDTKNGWTDYFRTFGLDVMDQREMVSRYNVYYWAPFLRSSQASNLQLARVKESEYKLNAAGEMIWLLHKHLFRRQMAGGMTFVLRNHK